MGTPARARTDEFGFEEHNVHFLHGVKIEANYNSVSYDAESGRYVHRVAGNQRVGVAFEWTSDIAALTLKLSGYDSENL